MCIELKYSVENVENWKNTFDNGGELRKQYGSKGVIAFTDPEWGASTAGQAISQGADVVFAAGGLTGNGGLVEVAAHKNRYCIGVDTDQWLTVPAARPCLVSCAVKQISPSVFTLIKRAYEKQFPSGNYYGGVSLSSFHDFDEKIPKQFKQKLAEIEEGLRKGNICIK